MDTKLNFVKKREKGLSTKPSAGLLMGYAIIQCQTLLSIVIISILSIA